MSDLCGVTLLRDEVQDGWTAFFASAGAGGDLLPGGPTFAHCELSYSAAERGLGVALAYTRLIEHDIARGTLVRPFEIETDLVVIYSIAYPERAAGCPQVKAFRDWLLAEASPRPANLHLVQTS